MDNNADDAHDDEMVPSDVDTVQPHAVDNDAAAMHADREKYAAALDDAEIILKY